MRLETRTLYSLPRLHGGLGAPRARPPERSADRGAPRATANRGPRGRRPPDLARYVARDENSVLVGAGRRTGEARHGRSRRSGAGIVVPRERRRKVVRGGEA